MTAIKIRVLVLAAALCLPVLFAAPAALAELSGGAFTVPVLVSLSGGGSAAGGVFSVAAINLGGPSFSVAAPAGGDLSLASGAAPVLVVTDSARSDLGAAHCYPVPFKPSAGHTRITFTALTRSARVSIYTISGELVRALEKDDSSESLDWDVKNARGQNVASGVYVFTVKSGGRTATGKLMVIW